MEGLFGNATRTLRMVAMSTLVMCLQGSNARGTQRALTDFHHVAWTLEKGIGAVYDIQQGPDGYLWLTTANGIFRFDGVRFQSVDEATNGAVHNRDLDTGFMSRDGSLFLSPRRAPELLRWKNGHLTKYPDRRCTPGVKTGGIVEDRDGSLWIQASAGLAHFRNGVCEHIGNESGYTGGYPASIFIDRRWTLWVKARSGDVMTLPAGQSKFELFAHEGAADAAGAFLHEAPDGSIWLSDIQGLRRITDRNGGLLHEPRMRGQLRGAPLGNFTFAGDGSLWAATATGVERFASFALQGENASVDAGQGESFTPQQGLSSDVIWKVFADREGLIWIGTSSGLDQLRRTALSTLLLPRSQQHQLAIAAGRVGSIWIGSLSLALTNVTEDGTARSFPKTAQSRSIYRDPNGEIWAAGFGKSRLWRTSGATAVPVPMPNENFEAVANIAVDKNGEPWINTFAPNVYRHGDGKWEQENKILGRKPGVIGTMRGDDAGNVWFAFSSSLVQWDGNRYNRYSSAPVDISVMTLAFRDDRVWVGGVAGIEMFRQGHFVQMRWVDEDLPGRVTGVVETGSGELWVNGFSGIVHVTAAELAKWLRDPSYAVQAERLGALDGLPGLVAERWPEPSLVESPERRLWFATSKGVAWLDPTAFEKNRNHLPPPVQIETVTADGKTIIASNGIVLPKLIHNLRIDYTALSLKIPEKVQFRYKLEGVDKDWQEAGARRQAYYNDPKPKQYRFLVKAANNDGVWNTADSALSFSIDPAWYQTRWFEAMCIAGILAVLWAIYRYRLYQLAHEFNVRLEERVRERTRLARDLHDTLLQSFQGLMLRLQAVDDLLPEGKAKDQLDQTLQRADQAIAEGRTAVYDLRSSTTTTNDLAQALQSLGDELATADSAAFRLVVEGTPRDLHPIIRDEIYRIAREALRNATGHAEAQHIETEITYGERALRLRIRDDGKGVPSAILKQGRGGHYGLTGMRERARQIGGKLEIWSGPQSGTEIELSVASAIAYKTLGRRSLLGIFRKTVRPEESRVSHD